MESPGKSVTNEAPTDVRQTMELPPVSREETPAEALGASQHLPAVAAPEGNRGCRPVATEVVA